MEIVSGINMNIDKNFKIFGVRGSMLGDSIMALPVLNYLEKIYPNSYKYWSLAKKYSQLSQIYLNHPLIDKIQITDGDEGMCPGDIRIANSCDLVINTMPNHTREDWFNHYNIYEETFMMAGFPLEEYRNLSPDQQRPKLEKWFNIEKFSKKIAIFPFAGYNRESKRSPSVLWYKELCSELSGLGYWIFHFGHFNEPLLEYNYPYTNFTKLPLFDQIKMALGCDLVVGTDSGTALVIGAYEHPQISLLTNHWPGHITNPMAFSTNNLTNKSFFAANGADNIKINDVINYIKSI